MSSLVALRRFLVLLLEVPPFISGMKLIHDRAVAKYPLASVGSVMKSAPNLSFACNRPCFHSQYTDIAIQFPELSYLRVYFEQCWFANLCFLQENS